MAKKKLLKVATTSSGPEESKNMAAPSEESVTQGGSGSNAPTQAAGNGNSQGSANSGSPDNSVRNKFLSPSGKGESGSEPVDKNQDEGENKDSSGNENEPEKAPEKDEANADKASSESGQDGKAEDDSSDKGADKPGGVPDKGGDKDTPSEGSEDAGKASEGVGKAQEAAQSGSQTAQAANNAGEAANAAEKASEGAQQASDAANAAGAAQGASGGAAGAITPKDLKEMKDLDVKGDTKDAAKDLAKGDLNGLSENETARKALDTAAKTTGNPYVVAANEALKLNDELKKHGGGVDLNKLAKGEMPSSKDLAKNAEAAGEVAKDKLGGGSSSDDGTDIADGDAANEGTKTEDEVSEEEAKEKEDKEQEEDSESDKDKEEDEKEEEEDDKDDGKGAGFGKKLAKKAAMGTAQTAATVAPKIMLIKAAYAFAQWLYMILMSIIQAVAKAVLFWVNLFLAIKEFFVNLGLAIWNGLCSIGQFVLGAFTSAATAVQSFVTGTVTTVVAVVCVVLGIAALRYDAELMQILSDDKGIVFTTGCSEAQRSFWDDFIGALTGDPVPTLDKYQKHVMMRVSQIMRNSDDAYGRRVKVSSLPQVCGVLATAYKVSNLDPFYISGEPDGWKSMTDILDFVNGEFSLKSADNLASVHNYVDTHKGVYGIGLFQFRATKERYLMYCQESREDNWKDFPVGTGYTSAGYDWYNFEMQLAYMYDYPALIAGFTQSWDYNMLSGDGIEDVRTDIDYTAHSYLSSFNKDSFASAEDIENQREAAYAAVMFLGTFERSGAYLSGSEEERNKLCAERAAVAVSLYRSMMADASLRALDSTYAGLVLMRVRNNQTYGELKAATKMYTNCGINTAAWDLDSPAAVAVLMAQPTRQEALVVGGGPSQPLAYMLQYDDFPKWNGYLEGVGTHNAICTSVPLWSYLVSGWDNGFFKTGGWGCDGQIAYVNNSTKWERIGSYPRDGSAGYYTNNEGITYPLLDTTGISTMGEREAVWQPGDVLFDADGIGGLCKYGEGDPSGHVYMYVGNEVVRAVWEANNGVSAEAELPQELEFLNRIEIVSASMDDFYPALFDFNQYTGNMTYRMVEVWRCIHPDNGEGLKDVLRYGSTGSDQNP